MDNKTAWVVTANMGLGHQRATAPLIHLAHNGIQLFGEEDETESTKEKRLWKLFQSSYESLSRTREIPVIGRYIFSILERLQNISPYYPFRDQSQPSFQVKFLSSLIKRGMGQSLCSKISGNTLPVITSFYAAAIAAEQLTDLPVCCIVCDADINRVWVSKHSAESRIIYFTPCGRAMRRLKQYGVPDDRIYLTGFPLPHENIGGLSMPVLKHDLANRLTRLDPTGRFHIIHGGERSHYLGKINTASQLNMPVTITYAIGGAGAQTKIAADLIASLSDLIRSGRIRLNLVAGIRENVKQYFVKQLQKHKLLEHEAVNIIYKSNINEYFREFSRILHTTDLLWTKPSELSFYCGLGIPVIISPCIGPHEVANKHWLRDIGAGIPQQDPRYCGEWIMDYLTDGRFAQAAWDGFLYARKMGTYKIEEYLATGSIIREISPLKR